MTGASAFSKSVASYTYQEFLGLGFTKLTEGLVLAARFRQQTTWNWSAFRQLILDNDFGLRGYNANRFSGENRIISNVELRYFPDIPIWIVNLSGVAFWDNGAVWNQDKEIFETRFYNSAGLGLRIHFTKSSSPSHTMRIDFAYNFADGNFGGIIFSTRQLFSAFGNHDFKLPEIFGSIIDLE
jgi:hemolysin activation/secretion protein